MGAGTAAVERCVHPLEAPLSLLASAFGAVLRGISALFGGEPAVWARPFFTHCLLPEQ